MQIPILFEDSQVLVLNKPPGLVVTSTETHSGKTLEDILKKDFQIGLDRGGIVHRLDKDTSGVIVVAKTQGALENLQSQFKLRLTSKEYWVLVHGLVQKAGRVEGEIIRNPKDREKFTVATKGESLPGKEAITTYTPVEKLQMPIDKLQTIFSDFNKNQMRKLHSLDYRSFTLVVCHPVTGRTHQIRVHLKHIGFPVVGDKKYVGRKMGRLDRRWCKRQFLHAHMLSFLHPQTNRLLTFKSPLPPDLKEALSNLDGTNQ